MQLNCGVSARAAGGRRVRSGRRVWRKHCVSAVPVFALDAALPFDYEAQARKRLEAERNAADKLVIGPSPFVGRALWCVDCPAAAAAP